MTTQESGELRVCHVASGDLWAGAEVQIASLLSELGSDPSLDVRAILLNRGTLHDRLTAAGVSTQVLDENVLGSMRIAAELYRFNRDWKPHVVHTHRYKENFLGGLAASCARVPVIVHTIHGTQEALAGWDNLKWRLYTLIARETTKRVASGLIGVSLEISSTLRKSFPRLEVACIHNGIQLDRVAQTGVAELTREAIGIGARGFVIGTVGRLTPVKGIEYLLQAASLLVHDQTVPSMQVVIAGEGPSRAALEGMALRLGVHECVRFLGQRQDVPQLLRLYDIFALPSLHEGIPMALLEALAVGCPVIASAVGGVPEVIRDGTDGMLVPPRDPAAIAQAIRALHASQPLRARYRQAGPKRVATEFTAVRMTSCTKEFYVKLVERASAR